MKRILTLLLVCALVLSGCGGNGTAPSDSSDNGTEAKPKETLVVAQGGDITSLDPLYARNTLSVTANQHLYDYLVFLTDDGEIVPGLAESWEQPTDVQIIFNLRKGVKFHNGDEMTADDVVFSLIRVRDLNQVTWAANFISDINKIDDYTVEVNFIEPYAGTLSQFTRPGANIVPKKVVEANPESLATQPIGTGPYKFVEWVQGNYMTMERFDDYWGEPGKSKFINIRIIGETAQRLIGLENGEIDIAYDIAANDITKIESNPDLNIITGPSARCVFISSNLILDHPIANKKVRQAMQYAIDKESIIEAVSYGKGVIAHTLVPDSVFGHTTKIKTEYNLEKAKALMVEAGYPDGFSVQLHTYSDQLYTEVAQILQSQLEQIGIKVELLVTDQATMIEMTSNKDHQLILKFWLTVADAHNTLYPYYFSKSSAAAGNSAFFSNEEYDRVVTEGKVSSDPAVRQEAYERCYEIAAEELPYIPIYFVNLLIGANSKVDGFSVNPYGYHRLDTVSVVQ